MNSTFTRHMTARPVRAGAAVAAVAGVAIAGVSSAQSGPDTAQVAQSGLTQVADEQVRESSLMAERSSQSAQPAPVKKSVEKPAAPAKPKPAVSRSETRKAVKPLVERTRTTASGGASAPIRYTAKRKVQQPVAERQFQQPVTQRASLTTYRKSTQTQTQTRAQRRAAYQVPQTSVATTPKRTVTNTAAPTGVAPQGTTGARAGYNPFPYGECTYGAAEMWKRHTGYYPAVNGNASAWGGSARAAGYTVGYTPRANSIVVMQPGQGGAYSAGHVAWVNSANGSTINITEMNSSGRRYFTNRTLNGSGMQYIYAP